MENGRKLQDAHPDDSGDRRQLVGQSRVEAQPLALSLPDLLPGGCQTVKTKLAGVPGRWWEEQDRRITLGIVDPMTGRDAVRFAMQTAQEDGRTVLFAGE